MLGCDDDVCDDGVAGVCLLPPLVVFALVEAVMAVVDAGVGTSSSSGAAKAPTSDSTCSWVACFKVYAHARVQSACIGVLWPI